MHDLIADGNSIVLVDHDTEILRDADWLIEMGPGAGENGGTILTQGTVEQVTQSPASRIGPFLADLHTLSARTRTPEAELFALGTITLRTRAIHTVKPLEVRLPKGRLIAVTGVSGSGKTTLVLESLIPALEAAAKGDALPAHVESITAPGIAQVKLIDATPIGINVRSTVATYANVHDELRKIYARSPLPGRRATRRAIFPTTRAACAAPAATAPAPSAWTSSSCRMWRSPARTAAAPATRRMPPPSTAPGRTAPRPRACPA